MVDKKTQFVTMECPVQQWTDFVAHQVNQNKWVPIAALRTERFVYVTFKCAQ